MEARLADHSGDSFLKRTVKITTVQRSRPQFSGFCKIQECPQHVCSAHLTVRRNIGSSNRGEYDTFLTGAGGEHVQPALTAFSRYRTKVKEGARLVCRNTIAHRDKYHVTLVALNCFQIFHE